MLFFQARLGTEDLAVGRSSRRQSSFLLGGIAAASADGVFLTGFSIGANVKEENMQLCLAWETATSVKYLTAVEVIELLKWGGEGDALVFDTEQAKRAS